MSLERSKSGFTLVETAVALLLGMCAVAALAVLGERLSHQGSDNEANANATALATRKMEELVATHSPSSDGQLNPPGAHGPETVDENGQSSVGGPYRIDWFVADDVPYTRSKQIRVTVTLPGRNNVQSELLTYLPY